MSVNKYLEELAKPFGAESVKWRLQGTNKEKTGGWAVAYLDSRAIAKRLDNVVGQMRWKDEYKPWVSTKEGASQLCTIYIYDDEIKEWIGKSDGAGLSNIEPIKGGLSDAFKRAAVKWGIGRYLYAMEPVWVKAKAKGNSAIIEDEELPKLKQKYIAFMQSMANNTPVQPAPQQTLQPISQPTAQQESQKSVPLYEVLGVRKQKGTKDENSLLQIKFAGKTITAYYNGTDNNLKSGTKLGRAVFSSRDTAYGKVHILQDYDIAA